MINVLSFADNTRPIKLPQMSEGIGNGITVHIWVRRTGNNARQRIVQFGTAQGEYLVLGTGDDPSSITVGFERGTTRNEMTCEGVLPLNTWVKVSATWFPLFQLASLSIFDIHVEQQIVGEFPTSPLTRNSIAGGAAGNPFVGNLSNLEVLQLPAPSWFGPSSPSIAWAKYPLDSVTNPKTVTTSSGDVTTYTVNDTSAKNNDGVVEGKLSSTQAPDGYGLGSVPVLEMTGDPKTLFLSPVNNLSGALTLETWFNPISTKVQQSMIILADEKDVSLVVTVGGNSDNGGGHIDVMLCNGTSKIRLHDGAYGENAGTFQHVAVTFGRGAITSGMVPIVITLYLNGQLHSSRTVMSNRIVSPMIGNGSQYLPLLRIMHAKSIPQVRLGGTIAGFAKFTGQLSEFRIWNTCRSSQEIAANFLSRLIGNESGLIANYRLEQSKTGCVFDISDQRGVGTLQTGTTIGTANNLPLLHTSNPKAPYLRVKGKLITEQLTYMADVLKPANDLGQVLQDIPGTISNVFEPNINPNLGIVSSVNWVRVKEPRTGSLTVFDATLEPTAPSGSSQAGKTIQICPDADVRVYLPNSDNVYIPTSWPAKQVQSMTVPANGKLRLRFEATTLVFPTLRARYSDMAGGLWTIVRPDSEAMLGLAYTDSAKLLSPPPGKPSPLPAGSSQEDANRFGSALVQMGRCYRPIAYSSTQSVGEARGILGSIIDGINTAVDFAEDTASSAYSGLKKAGSSAGRFAEAMIDDGSVALSKATSTAIKKSSDLLCSASDELRDLTNATAKAAARFGRDQIEQCIASADRLAVLSTQAANIISHTFSLIGTSIVDGVTVAWRVVVSGVMDAYHAIVQFMKKVGAKIEQILKYLAWLFNWNDFLNASDKLYSTIETELGKAKDQIAKLATYKTELNKYLTLPAGVGDKSLAQHCGIDIPDNLGAEEIDYVMDIANTVMSATNLNLDFMGQISQQVSSGTALLDTTKLQQFSGSSPSDLSSLGNPVAILTTPVSQVVNKLTTGDAQTSVVDFLFEQLTNITDTVLGSAKAVLTTRLSVPNVTSWVESMVLGGRTLNLLRIGALVAAIAQVLAVKIGASAKSGKAEPQPVSFADDSEPADYSAQIWSNFALGVTLAALQIPRALIDIAESKDSSDAVEKASAVKMAAWDTAIGVVMIARCGLSYYSNLRLPRDVQIGLGIMNAMEGIAGSLLILCSWSKAAFWAINSKFFVSLTKILDMLGQFVCVSGACIGALAATLSSPSQSALNWTAFGLQVGSYITNQMSLLFTAYIDFNKTTKISPYTPVGFSVATSLLDLGSGITNVVQNA